MTNRKFKHFKGGMYTHITDAILEKDRTTVMVIYRDNETGIDYCRPAYEFFGEVAHGDKLVKRFEEVV